MKKLLVSALAVAGLMAASIGVVQAATAVGSFNVTVSLTAVCSAGTASGALNFGTYTAITGGASNATPSINMDFNCTRGVVITGVAFDTTNGTNTGTGTTGAGAGVIDGLYYTLSSTAPTLATTGIAPTAAGGVNAVDADVRRVAISGAMPANQAGTITGATGTQARTLTITF